MSKQAPVSALGESSGLSDADLLRLYRLMLLARRLDERMWVVQRQGKAPFHISCQGQEAAQVGAAAALVPGVDLIFPYYRDLGVVLSLGMTAREVMLALFGRAEDPSSGGRQMPNHFSYPALKIFTGSSPVMTQVPHAAGAALAARIRGEQAVAFASFGEGSTSQGDFHEGVNFAAIWRLPVIFFCENNRYAISVPIHKQMAVESVADRAAAYGIAGERVDGNDVLAVYEAVKRARQRALAGEGPTLIDAQTYRMTPHSSDDDDRAYRTREEVEEWRRRDPIERYRTRLLEAGVLTEEEDSRIQAEVAQTVDDAHSYAEAAPSPAPETAMRHVFYEGRGS